MNIYLHDLDRRFHAGDGPAAWAKAGLVRYADDFVILAKFVYGRIEDWVKKEIEGHLGLTLNRAKTRTVDLKQEGASLDFLGYTYRYDRDIKGRPWWYLNVFPSKKSVQRICEKMRNLTGPSMCFMPTPVLIGTINAKLRSWANYFGGGYPTPHHGVPRRGSLRQGTTHQAPQSSQSAEIPMAKGNNGLRLHP